MTPLRVRIWFLNWHHISLVMIEKEYKLTPKEVTAWQQAMGQMNYDEIYSIVTDPRYSSLSDADREEGLTKIVNGNYNKVKEAYLQYKGIKK